MAIDYSILDNLERTVEDIEKSIFEGLRESIDQNKDVLITQQTDGQMYKGLTKLGTPISPDYAESTKTRKRYKKQPYDRVTLRDTGDFYDSIDIEAKDTEFVISTPISYSIYLVKKYDDIFGIIDEFMSKFVESYSLPIIKTNIDDIIAKS